MPRPVALGLPALLACLLALSSPALAAPGDAQPLVRLASGRKDFTYRAVYARNLEQLMRGYRFSYLPSEGSGENLELLADGRADVAFAQADVYAAKLAADPTRFAALMPIGRIASECVYLARRKQGGVRSLDELAAKAASGGAAVAVGDAASGMAGTFAYLQRLQPRLAPVKSDPTAGTLALNQLAIGRLDAVGWVTDPDNADQKMLRAVLANDALAWLPLEDPALAHALPDGTRIYERRKVRVGEGLRADELETICTSALLFARRDASPALVDKLADIVGLQSDKLAGRKKK
jgi:TRAP-type uncharacterized transport system substrate-binding protein